MSYFFSASTGGFYTSGIHDAIPADAVPLTEGAYAALLSGQAAGRVISTGTDGLPVLIYPPAPDPAAELSAWRASAAVSRFQARAALHAAGRLADVELAVAASNDPLTQLAWAESVEFRRSSPTIAALAAAIGMTDAEVDQLFVTAAQISA